MAKTKISEFNSNPALNTDIDSINIAEGCAPSGINDAIRELMSQLKDWQSGTSNDPMVIGSSGSLTLNQGTANGVAYLNGSKVVTSGSALTFDGTNLTLGANTFIVKNATGDTNGLRIFQAASDVSSIFNYYNASLAFGVNNTEQMRLTSTGLGIGTSSPASKLQVTASSSSGTSGADGARFNAGGNVAINIGAESSSGYGWIQSANWGSGYINTAINPNGGNVGIGTSSPATKLTVYAGADGDVGFFRGGSTRQVQIGTSSTAGYINTDNGSAGLELRTNGTARATLDTSGNLGLGVTPSAWGGSYKAFQLNSAGRSLAATGAGVGDLTLAFNAIYDSSDSRWEYAGTGDAAVRYSQTGAGIHAWYTAASGTAGNAITFTQAMTLDASGNLGLGNTSPQARFHSKAGATSQAGIFEAANSVALLSFVGSSTSSYTRVQLGADVNDMVMYTSGSERARIDSSGNLLVGTTATVNAAKSVFSFSSSNNGVYLIDSTGVSGAQFMRFDSTSNTCGSITRVGTTSAVAYNTSSDYRLKNTIAPMTGALAKVALLKPCTYKWNADGSDGEGFIAHELAEVVPQCVTGEKDAVDDEGNPKYQGIDVSFLVATLTAAIQELKAEFDAYKASHP